MKRTITAVLAAFAVLGLAGAGTANASGQQGESIAPTVVPAELYISEVATRLNNLPLPTEQEFIEICTRATEPFVVPMGGIQVQATFSGADRRGLVVEIPAGTVIHPGQAYVIASPTYTLTVPDQIFETTKNLPDLFGIGLVNPATNITFDSFATIATSPFAAPPVATPLTPNDPRATSLSRVNFTGINKLDFVKTVATPGLCNPVQTR
ncbi:hypothetical protein JOF56_003832 [Kibdelosporangium banguiense]|uniref:LTD domain-containing protein n=1 Tax=Kibdelosporangium banguiense TaxID=1365924 RepID=A0ABS4TGB4_9PSEU|nr:hypothetical protein [Kibdelosporangium banguiense]MBP2323447.1 hypothetical protein [Kibdelosporangium banguiense]